MFTKKKAVRLTPADLKRFGPDFCRNLEALLPGRSLRPVPLTDWPDPEGGPEDQSLVLPLIFRGRELGYLIISPAEPEPENLAELLRQALESMWLRKALLTDRESGLYSRDYFARRLLKNLRRHRRQAAGRPLSLDGASAAELFLVMVELREAAEPGPALADFVERLGEDLAPRCPARLSARRLAFLCESRPEELRLIMESALDAQLEAEPASRPVAAWARYPRDLAGSGEEGDRARLQSQAQLLWERADTALFYARQSRASAVAAAFGDLIERYGQVVQILPQGRAVLNLGRDTGAAAGQVFLVSSPRSRPSDKPEYKAEVTIFETADSYSLAQVTGLKSSRSLVAGDCLSFSRRDFEAEAAAGDLRPPNQAFLAALPDKPQFLQRLTDFSSRPLALLLARLDGYEKTQSMLGREEAERLLAFALEKTAAALPPTEIKTLWRPDTLALVWPGAGQAELGPAAHRLAAEMRASGPISLGLVFSPGGASPEEMLEDGRKALNEAAFSGQGQVAVFGPLALNISGDRLFEGGDLSGALREYERGLAVSPGHLNLLNSLGVCHGRLGNSQEALETFEKIIELDPENLMAHYNLGYTHLLAGRLDEAEKALARAAELAPDNFETLFHLGKTALELGHLDRALPALKRAGQLAGARPVVFRLLGEALMLTNERPAALDAFKKAVKNAPNDAYALSTLGALFVDLANDLEPARSLFQRSVEIDPTNSLYRQRLGRLLFTLGDFDGAEHHLRLAIEYGSRAPEVHYQLGRLAEENGRRTEALAHFQAALEQDPAYRPALEKIG
ncbi:MAG: tetratricopeptide repeat protein [Candidatus Adiutrix sp.]|jgi:tetratricopeptide (TPR) repeat protein|nr:tetratricopeptide repeat protein [Candidatus Adiutrix sp.]